MTIRDLVNILKKYKEQQQQVGEAPLTVTPDEVRARQLLKELMEVYDNAYNARKEKWFNEHPGKTVFEPSLEEIKQDMKLEEWFFYFVNRIAMSAHERYYDTLAVGGTDKEAQEERDKTSLDILMDYKDYPDFNKVLNIWTHGK